ncbi:MAG: cbpA [Herbaspirillum sp.]|jgi:curved DNA-binding protein|nr:cbpA [Herbaspirillum sp.]
MKYKDYYEILGVGRKATTDEIKKAYRKLARRYHPDVSKDPQGEAKFKDIAEAYATLRNPESRQEYDNLGRHAAGQDFSPPPEWRQRYGGGTETFDDIDLADILNAFRGGRQTRGNGHAYFAQAGEDYSVTIPVTLEDVYHGGETEVALELLEIGLNGLPHRVPRTFRVTIPKGATEGQRLRLAGLGGPGTDGGKPGDLYMVLTILPHPLYRISGNDLYFNLMLAPWEAVLGATVQVPTLAGKVELSVKPGTAAGQQLRLAKRGLHGARGGIGDLYAVVHIAVPTAVGPRERDLYQQLSAVSAFNPRTHPSKRMQ